MPHYTLQRRQRIAHQRDFERLVKTARSARDQRLIVYVLPNDLGLRRVGISVGRRIGGAVQRNRVKRLLRESFRLLQHELPPHIDLLLVARPGIESSLGEFQESLRGLVSRAARGRPARP